VIGIIGALPAALVRTIAGLALLGPLTGAMGAALTDPDKRFPAILTFVATASGLTLIGIGSAFWGLAAGLIALALERAALRLRTPHAA
jgi:benzoate membrane transport protein